MKKTITLLVFMLVFQIESAHDGKPKHQKEVTSDLIVLKTAFEVYPSVTAIWNDT